MKSDFSKLFIFSAQSILVVTGAAKVFSATGDASILNIPDPVFGLKYAVLMFVVGLTEILASISLFVIKPLWIRYSVIFCFGFGFFLYNLSLSINRLDQWCPCLGTLTDRLRLNPTLIHRALGAVVLYLILGSLIGIFCPRRI